MGDLVPLFDGVTRIAPKPLPRLEVEPYSHVRILGPVSSGRPFDAEAPGNLPKDFRDQTLKQLGAVTLGGERLGSEIDQSNLSQIVGYLQEGPHEPDMPPRIS